MVTHIEQPFDGYLLYFSCKFIGVVIISTADYSFELLVLISAVCNTKNSSRKIDESPLPIMKHAVTMIRQNTACVTAL